MWELETTLQQFGEFLLKARLVKEKAAPHCVTLGPALSHATCLERAPRGPVASVL